MEHEGPAVRRAGGNQNAGHAPDYVFDERGFPVEAGTGDAGEFAQALYDGHLAGLHGEGGAEDHDQPAKHQERDKHKHGAEVHDSLLVLSTPSMNTRSRLYDADLPDDPSVGESLHKRRGVRCRSTDVVFQYLTGTAGAWRAEPCIHAGA